jgi:hypothetical protein
MFSSTCKINFESVYFFFNNPVLVTGRLLRAKLELGSFHLQVRRVSCVLTLCAAASGSAETTGGALQICTVPASALSLINVIRLTLNYRLLLCAEADVIFNLHTVSLERPSRFFMTIKNYELCFSGFLVPHICFMTVRRLHQRSDINF